MTGLTGAQQRINEQLRVYWEELRGNRFYPKEEEVDVEALSAIWDSCFVVKRDQSAQHGFTYIYLGKKLMEAYGDDMQEKEICEKLVFPSAISLLDKFREVVETQKPVEHDGSFINTKQLDIRYRSLLLPLGDNHSDAIGFIIGGMRWKSYL